MKIALIVSGLVIVGAVIYYFVNQQARRASSAATGAASEIDPVTGQRWQTVAEANAQQAARETVQDTTAGLH